MALLGHAEMMKQHEQGCKQCARQLNSGNADINGTMIPMMDASKVQDMGINAPFYMSMMPGD